MLRLNSLLRLVFACSILPAISGITMAQNPPSAARADDGSNFGPVMRAYLGYLSNEQEVVDDRISRREISSSYYHRNSNRIRALRQMAIRLVRQSENDYVPELEAVAVGEFGILFEKPPNPISFHPNEVLANKFRFLGVVRAGEVFYLFARLDPYEQADLMQGKGSSRSGSPGNANIGISKGQHVGQTTTRPRRVTP